ncbi:MAG: hypothetical protein LBT59_01745, partial [Clostridiales bacterium]|nr:hypothetical protein [Clostridiales bacterium]
VRNLGTEVMELRLNPLYFSEFAQAFGYEELYESVDLYGSSDPEKYNELHELFEKYLLCGGYPSVVQEYLLHNDIYFANKELERMHGLIVEDLSNACLPTVDICFLKTTIDATASLLLANKSNHQEFAKITDLLREMSIVENEASRKTLEHVIPWIFRTNLIGICGRALNCKYPFIRHLYKFYFSDVGLARWLIERTSKDRNALDVLSKNYVFNIINNYAYDFKFYPYFPVAATYNGGEIDFLFRNKKYRSEFAVDVIYSECSEKPTSSYTALKDGIVNRLVRFQGEGPFGKDGEIYTVPIYLIERFDFNIGGFRCPELSTLPTFLPGELDKSQR